jgi:hypothetical protein
MRLNYVKSCQTGVSSELLKAIVEWAATIDDISLYPLLYMLVYICDYVSA